jgi:hypothetical protein
VLDPFTAQAPFALARLLLAHTLFTPNFDVLAKPDSRLSGKKLRPHLPFRFCRPQRQTLV